MTALSSSPVASVAPTAPSHDLAPSSFGEPASEARVQRAVEGLRSRGFEVVVVSTREEAREAVLARVPAGSEVLDASSKTVTELGLNEIFADPTRYQGLRASLGRLRSAGEARELRKAGAAPDYVVGSVHAVTESGQVLVASASGSQLAPYVSGAGKVLWVVGQQKLVGTVDEAFRRLEEYVYPREDARALQAYGVHSTIAKVLLVNREIVPGRTTIVLLRESIGF